MWSNSNVSNLEKNTVASAQNCEIGWCYFGCVEKHTFNIDFGRSWDSIVSDSRKCRMSAILQDQILLKKNGNQSVIRSENKLF